MFFSYNATWRIRLLYISSIRFIVFISMDMETRYTILNPENMT